VRNDSRNRVLVQNAANLEGECCFIGQALAWRVRMPEAAGGSNAYQSNTNARSLIHPKF